MTGAEITPGTFLDCKLGFIGAAANGTRVLYAILYTFRIHLQLLTARMQALVLITGVRTLGKYRLFSSSFCEVQTNRTCVIFATLTVVHARFQTGSMTCLLATSVSVAEDNASSLAPNKLTAVQRLHQALVYFCAIGAGNFRRKIASEPLGVFLMETASRGRLSTRDEHGEKELGALQVKSQV